MLLSFATSFLLLLHQQTLLANGLSISEVWQSTYDKSHWYENVTQLYGSSLDFSTNFSVLPNIFPTSQQQLQPILGMGAGITDSVALTLEKVRNSNETQYWDTLNLLFNQSDYWRAKGGAALNVVRSPLGSSDFSIAEYTFDDTYDRSPDVNFTLFSIERAPKVFDLLQDITSVNPDIKLFFAPWSGPAWLKINANNNLTHGGEINPLYYDQYATYLVKAMEAIKKRGLNPYMLSLQNEPLFNTVLYSGTLVLPEVEALIGEKVRKGLDEAGLQEIGLTAYDHNWDEPQYPITVFNLTSPGTFASASWHCYAGSPASGQSPFLLSYPTIPQFFSECTRITQYHSEPYSNLKQNSVQLLTGSLDYGSRAIILWNAVLEVDINGFTSPHLDGVCANCLAPLQIYDDGSGNGLQVIRTSDFVLLAHASLASRKFDSPSTSSSSTQGKNEFNRRNKGQDEYYLTARKIGVASLDPNLVTQAFEARNEKGCSRFSLTILNQNDRYETGYFINSTANIFFRGQTASLDLPVGLTTLSWYAPTDSYSSGECGPSVREREAYSKVEREESRTSESSFEWSSTPNGTISERDYSPEYVEFMEENQFAVQGQMAML